MSSAGRVVACALAAAAALSGCFLFEEDCAGDADCGEGQVCREGLCLDAPAPVVPDCGNGRVDPLEACDPSAPEWSGRPDECRGSCALVRCGDGIVDPGETCDDGDLLNGTPSSPCPLVCRLVVCGDGFVDPPEACDDGNRTDRDGCDPDCSLPGCGNDWAAADEVCDEGVSNGWPGARCGVDCTPPEGCGDGVVGPDEACDPAAGSCRSDCGPLTCGDGVRDAGEACDDGNRRSWDGCSSYCELECDRYVQVAAADEYSLALRADGRLFAVGWNRQGQLGRGETSGFRSSAVREVAGGHRFVSVSAAYRHTLAIDTQGRLWAWGWSDAGQCGPDAPPDGNVFLPIEVTPRWLEGRRAVAVRAAGSTSFVWLEDGAAVRFGNNEDGQLGVPPSDPAFRSHVPEPGAFPSAVMGVATAIDSLDGHTAAIFGGEAWVWGATGEWGRALAIEATPHTVQPPTKVSIDGATLPLRGVAVGPSFTVFLDAAGRVFGGGANGEGPLGVGAQQDLLPLGRVFDAPLPPEVEVPKLVELGANGWSLFARDEAGRIWSAGTNPHGRLGRAETGEVASYEPSLPVSSFAGPVDAPTPLPPFTQLSVGRQHVLLLDDAGHVWGFGGGNSGVFGDGSTVIDDSHFLAAPTRLDEGRPDRASGEVADAWPLCPPAP